MSEAPLQRDGILLFRIFGQCRRDGAGTGGPTYCAEGNFGMND